MIIRLNDNRSRGTQILGSQTDHECSLKLMWLQIVIYSLRAGRKPLSKYVSNIWIVVSLHVTQGTKFSVHIYRLNYCSFEYDLSLLLSFGFSQ